MFIAYVDSTKAEEAIEIILREGKVEQTKMGPKFGIYWTVENYLRE